MQVEAKTRPHQDSPGCALLPQTWLHIPGSKASVLELQPPPISPDDPLGPSSKEVETTDAAPLSEEQVAKVWEDLAEVRAAWHQGGAVPGGDFQTSLRGGAWTKQHKGVVADAVAATAATTEAKNWLHKVDGQTLMAGEWCRRRQFFFNLWMQQGAPR